MTKKQLATEIAKELVGKPGIVCDNEVTRLMRSKKADLESIYELAMRARKSRIERENPTTELGKALKKSVEDCNGNSRCINTPEGPYDVGITRTIKIVKKSKNLRELIEASKKNRDGISYYNKTDVERKLNPGTGYSYNNNKMEMLMAYLGDDDEVYYILKVDDYRILHKFSWSSCIHNGAAALVWINDEKFPCEDLQNTIQISKYMFDRETLRTGNTLWTC